jgi:MOSC domain-containing protein YiiM
MKSMHIRILSVNIGVPKLTTAKLGLTGIFKTPQSGSVSVSRNGLAGDAIVDLQHHGGLDQAVYVYCQRDYDWWKINEGLATHPGLFGENLTIQDMETSDAHVGARLISGSLVLEITSHRTPCDTFAARMNDSTFPKRFWRSRRTGFYCRVIHEGAVQAGATMWFQPFDGEIVSIAELISHDPYNKLDDATRNRFLSTPLHSKMREELQKVFEK